MGSQSAVARAARAPAAVVAPVPPPATVIESDGVSTTINPDEAALFLAYTVRVRWPAFVADATPTNRLRALPAGFNPTGTVRFNNSQKQVLFFAGTITR